MVRKSPIVFCIAIILGLSSLIFPPIFIINYTLKTYGTISELIPYYYASENISLFKELNLECDLGNMVINYVYPPKDKAVTILTSIEMSGPNLAEKKSSDLFNINMSFDDNSLNFSFKLKPSFSRLSMISLIKNISIQVNIRADANININADVINGDIKIKAYFGTKLRNLNLTTAYGSLLFDLFNCYFSGNITGSAGIGNIEFSLYDVFFTQNSVWKLTNQFGDTEIWGDILIDIVQNTGISANVSGLAITHRGRITVCYSDNNANVGANIIYYKTGSRPAGPFTNFDESSEIDLETWWINRVIYVSDDFPALGNHNISLCYIEEGLYYKNLRNN